MVYSLKTLPAHLQSLAGGKGSSLARMIQKRYPVPEGFVVLPGAFERGQLSSAAWHDIRQHLQAIRLASPHVLFAVRSSALSEDSAAASFAGEFDTVLNVKTDEEIEQALYKVHQSQYADRVQVYSSVQAMEQSHQVAIVIQRMVPSEMAGVLFTADPVTGSRAIMTGNYVYGLGEQLVSGEANAFSFSLVRPKGKYEGPDAFRRYASKLYRYASALEKEQGIALDLEWAVADGKLYLLQARPVTTLNPGNPDTFEWNDSRAGDDLWTNTNIGESIPDVVTPLSWSVLRKLDEEQRVIPGHYLLSGNICGRIYSNISVPLSAFRAFGIGTGALWSKMSNVFGRLPEGIEIPRHPFGKLELVKAVVPRMIYSARKTRQTIKEMDEFLKGAPEDCRILTDRIQSACSREELLDLWNRELWPRSVQALWTAFEGTSGEMQRYVKLRQKLGRLLGEEAAYRLLSSSGEGSGLESLGPLRGIPQLARGEISREEYMFKYGHRGPHEHELSIPAPYENGDWLEQQIKDFEASDIDPENLLHKQQVQNEEVWSQVKSRFPGKVKKIRKQAERAIRGPQIREAARSEWTRVFRVNRAFALKAGELTGLGEDIFFLYIQEILHWLEGGALADAHIPARKQTYAKYQSLPPFPSVIRGRFEPVLWSKDPNRRIDLYDPTQPSRDSAASEVLTGFAGASGRVEGSVRVLAKPEDGELLKTGEILVASTTNIGWTPLFPKAAAIITDVGAPLSHAAIVARELGIPAVVGCGNATARLKTGDRVIIDGGQGSIQILRS
ncbi:phosphoenolpyruvate synthase [Paenibacillus sp. CAA11]|nr:phosphoenolpyruvate synthase [Paenibacillus sp. CAA11]